MLVLFESNFIRKKTFLLMKFIKSHLSADSELDFNTLVKGQNRLDFIHE